MICLRRIALAVALLGSAPGLAAADGGASRPGTVAGADTNGDGVVTLSEARAAALRLFERFDRDADGVVTRAEASSPRPHPTRARSDARFAELDRDGDARLSRWESRLPPRRFARLDRDADGSLSPAELWQSVRRSRRQPADAARPLLWRRDLDGDGRVTRAEIERAADRRFRERDRDADGQLTSRDARSRRRPR